MVIGKKQVVVHKKNMLALYTNYPLGRFSLNVTSVMLFTPANLIINACG